MAAYIDSRASALVSQPLPDTRSSISECDESLSGNGGLSPALVTELDIWGRPAKSTPHNFEWALKVLRDGGRIRLPHWLEGCYIRVKDGQLIYHSGIGPEGSIGFSLEWHQIASRRWAQV